ncbi:flavin reductase family protein [Natroniella sulfidigena]|uniref:flavin reductase family protein n=1 Tax=Natroniella sulfidigena TaxID=723921 RepID=UPI00200B8373|nr:flavin reductase family protein [Natroniella sulfidigena]MCK8817950.1 flavin reductase family protein [Natroniella sulfidigena]
MREISYNEYLEEAMDGLAKGAFLTVKSGDELNTMTIGWGSIGYIWGKPVFTVLVRKSRYTYQLLAESEQFTVSIPLGEKMKQEINFCGTKSGRDYDKFKECNLEIIPANKVKVPLIKGCQLHYECQIKFRQQMDEDDLVQDYQTKWYSDDNQDDYHMLYFGEILATYLD